MGEHGTIWLQPKCCAGPEGQLWCEDDVGPCECGKPWVPYVIRAAVMEEAARLRGALTQAHPWLVICDDPRAQKALDAVEDALAKEPSHDH